MLTAFVFADELSGLTVREEYERQTRDQRRQTTREFRAAFQRDIEELDDIATNDVGADPRRTLQPHDQGNPMAENLWDVVPDGMEAFLRSPFYREPAGLSLSERRTAAFNGYFDYCNSTDPQVVRWRREHEGRSVNDSQIERQVSQPSFPSTRDPAELRRRLAARIEAEGDEEYDEPLPAARREREFDRELWADFQEERQARYFDRSRPRY